MKVDRDGRYIEMKVLKVSFRPEILAIEFGAISMAYLFIFKDKIFEVSDAFALGSSLLFGAVIMLLTWIVNSLVELATTPRSVVISKDGMYVKRGRHREFYKSNNVVLTPFEGVKFPFYIKESNILAIEDLNNRVIALIPNKNNEVLDKIKELVTLEYI